MNKSARMKDIVSRYKKIDFIFSNEKSELQLTRQFHLLHQKQ